ncbi:MAG TPA: hypothetical protein VLA60_10905 [Nitrospirales bacterium]|nr:hypothetical protein [Nitrospirales bacterium]
MNDRIDVKMTMTKSIHMLSMQQAINAATKMLDGFFNSTHCYPESQENHSSCRMTLVDHAIQGTNVCVEIKSEEIIHATPHPVSATPPADIQQ